MASSYDLGLAKFPFGSGVSSIAASIVLSLSLPAGSVPLQLDCRSPAFYGRGSMLHSGQRQKLTAQQKLTATRSGDFFNELELDQGPQTCTENLS